MRTHTLLRTALLTACLICSLGSPQSAHAFGLGFVGTFNSNGFDRSPNYQRELAQGSAGGGFLLSIDLVPFVAELELGALYTSVNLQSTSTALPIQYTLMTPMIVVPLMVKFSLLPILRVGIGAYGGFPNSPTQVNVTAPFQSATTADASNDFGAVGAVGLAIPMSPMLRLLVEARYYYGLIDLDPTAATVTQTRNAQGLLGLVLGF